MTARELQLILSSDELSDHALHAKAAILVAPKVVWVPGVAAIRELGSFVGAFEEPRFFDATSTDARDYSNLVEDRIGARRYMNRPGFGDCSDVPRL